MATLKLSCKNQALEWENNSEEIIAGNIKIDKIAFEFCELWDGFTKTAVFRKDDKALLVLLDNDCICEIPPEVTQTSGIVYIGVFGVKGDQKRTTEVKGLYLAEGVVTDGETPGEPTPDIYQQIVNLCTEAVETSKRVETETKELNEQSKAVLEAEAERMAAEEYRQYSEDERKNNELLRDEHESNRQSAEEERQQTFETLKDEFEHNNQAMSQGLAWFENESQQALDQFQADTSTALSGFDVEKQQALDHFAEQSEVELEKVQTATDRANEAVDNMPNVYANVLKGNKSGEAVVITDISPIEHNMGVKVSGVSDVGTVKVKKYGKNLLNRNATEVSKGTLTFDGNRQTFTSVGGGGDLRTKIGRYKDFVGKTITVSYTFVDYKGRYPSFYTYIQADSTALVYSSNYDKTTKLLKMTYTIPENDSAEFLTIRQYIGYITSVDGDYVTIDNFQVEIGDIVTEWEEYKEPITYTPYADGTVEGVKSIYPNMTLMTDKQGVLVECEYNKDTNKVIENLVNAIISLGGNV